MRKHMKRLRAPRTWTLARKEFVWAYKPRAGPHPLEHSLPIAHVLRGTLGLADTAREAERVIFSRQVLVDGRPVTDPKFPVGLMDIVSLVPTKAHYRVLLDRRGRLALVPIDAADAAWKLCRVQDRGTVKGGKFQVRLHDGRNLLLAKSEHTTGTTLKVSLPDQKVLGAIPLTQGHIALLTGGQHAGEIVHVDRVEKTRNPRANLVHFTEGFSTILDYVFVVGKETPEIRVPEGAAV
ncbi:MAG: 30S ribosomal protein S4e [Methanobacteriota archaeon]|nr:MAG: 30S ribosomal protein S4e [Euryarchaeota archaeon]